MHAIPHTAHPPDRKQLVQRHDCATCDRVHPSLRARLLLVLLCLLLVRESQLAQVGSSVNRGSEDKLERGGQWIQRRAADATRCDASLARPTALHPMASSVPCNACGRQMTRRCSRRTGLAFYGCRGFARHRCRFVRPAQRIDARTNTEHSYQVEIRAEMECADSFRLIAHPPGALRGLLCDMGLLKGLNCSSQPGNYSAAGNRTDTTPMVNISWYAREDGQEGAVLPLRIYSTVRRQLQDVAARQALLFEEIPQPTLRAFLHRAILISNQLGTGHRREMCGPALRQGLRGLPPAMRQGLMEYQLQGIEFVIGKRGRALIADEMGLGKSVQALGVAACMQGWPLLIVCPATMRLVWAEECERWLPNVAVRDNLHIIFSSADKPPWATPKIVIVSYKMVQRLRSDLLRRAWGLVIVDESHTLRTPMSRSEALQTSTIVKLLQGVARVVLLSGTPSPTRPLDLFLQCHTLKPGLLGRDKYDFIRSYCHVQRQPYFSVGRCKRAHELNLLLCEHVMIRRLKIDVMKELPPKVKKP